MHKKLFAMILAFVLLCSLTLPGSAVLPDNLHSADAPVPLSEEKVYCNATLEDDFADDRVVVVLNNEASTSLHTYTKADFAGIGCTKVQNLTQYTTAQVNAKLRGETAELQRTVEPNVITFAEFQEVDTENFHQILCLTLETPGKQNVLDAIDALMKHPDVISAEPDYVVYAAEYVPAVTPDDAYYEEQWAIDQIKLRQAWGYTTGSSTVRVGIIDSGIDGSHPELRYKINVALSRDYISGQDITPNTVDDIIDGTGHGTSVAGIIGAATDNGEGISGACFNVELVSLRVLDDKGYGHTSRYYQAIDHARNNNIPILNMSLAWCTSNYTQTENAAFCASLVQYGGLIVCAAGNNNNMPDGIATNIDNSNVTVYPAELDYDKLLVVGASTINDAICDYSNWGAQSVDLFAPGEDILTCHPPLFCEYYLNHNDSEYDKHREEGYHKKYGTSFAAPYVTGVASLILAEYPNLNAAQIKERIMESVDPVPALAGKCVSGGRLNAYKAVHPHTIGFVNNTATHHTWGCVCGLTCYKEEHTYVQVGQNLYVCEVCEYESEWLP